MSRTEKSGKARQDETKPLAEARREQEQPAGEFETEHDGARKMPGPDNDQRK